MDEFYEASSDYFGLSEAVDFLKQLGFEDVNQESLRRWEIQEELIRPAKRVQGTKTRVYTRKQLDTLAVIALLKKADMSTKVIKMFLRMKGRSKENLRAGFINEFNRLGILMGQAEGILNRV